MPTTFTALAVKAALPSPARHHHLQQCLGHNLSSAATTISWI